MAIPTSGITPATSYSLANTWSSTLTLIGDSENLIGENADGETATVNRAVKQAGNNTLWLRNLMFHADSGEGVYMPGGATDFNSLISDYKNKIFRYKLTLTLEQNLTLDAAYDEYFDFSNLFGIDEIEIDLNSKSISIAAGYTAKGYLFHFYKVNVPLLTIKDGTITDVSGNIGSAIAFRYCTGHMICDNISTVLTVSTNHYEFQATRGIVKNGTLNTGLNGIYARDISYVLSQDNTSAVNCNQYGLRSITGATIRKYDATQPAGAAGAETTSTGGTIS
jgi:hypothetical protein